MPADSENDVEAVARGRIGEMPYAYYSGGADREHLLKASVAAWDDWELHPHVLRGVVDPEISCTLLGSPLRTPIGLAPTAIQGLAHPDAELATARGAEAAGALFILSSLATATLEDVAAAAPFGIRWMQVYVLRDRAATVDLVQRASDAEYRALVLTVDVPVSGLRRREIDLGVHLPHGLDLPNLGASATQRARSGGFMGVVADDLDRALTFDDIAWLASLTDLPVVVKGVLRADDALRCLDAGASAIVVSNHGGRQLDDAPPSAHVLAEIADACGDAEVYVDGGIRRGPDVAKALALGARAAFIGRPQLWALACGGDDGVHDLVDDLSSELARALTLCGCANLAELDRSLVRRRYA